MKPWDYEIDATGLSCPMPLLKMKQALNSAKIGEVVMVKATDSASQRDFKSYIEMTDHELELKIETGIYLYWITKH